MESKRIVQVLNLLLDKLNDVEYAKIFKREGRGLCNVVYDLAIELMISIYEENTLYDIIYNSTSYRSIGGYIYKPGATACRKRLLRKLIIHYKQK